MRSVVPALPRKTHPVTWLTWAIVIAVLCWDVWQTFREPSQPPATTSQARSTGVNAVPAVDVSAFATPQP